MSGSCCGPADGLRRDSVVRAGQYIQEEQPAAVVEAVARLHRDAGK